MSDFERINQPRVEKILKMIDTIEKSAKSNVASGQLAEQIAEMLAPIHARLGTTSSAPASVNVKSPAQAHQWANAIQMAREADLEAAVAAMGVIATRVEQELYERRTAA